jgi:hypothetical protein
LLEFVVTLKNPTTGAVGFAVVNENSEVIFSKYVDVKYTYLNKVFILPGTQYIEVSFRGEDANMNYVCQSEIYSVSGTEQFSATPSSTSALKSASIETLASPFPNPASATIQLPYTLPAGKTGIVEVCNLSGALLKSFNVDGAFPTVVLDVTNYQPGAYIYKVIADGATVAASKFLVGK